MSKATFLDRKPEDLERYLLEQGRRDRGTRQARDGRSHTRASQPPRGPD